MSLLVCPKPIRLSLFNTTMNEFVWPLRCYQQEPYESNAGPGLLDIILIRPIIGGELFNKLVKGRLKEDYARMYFQQLISAVDFCHGRGVYHRDLKSENLLLDENESLKVTDFGLSALASCRHQDGLLHTTCGTPAYVVPEVIGRRGYDGAKADIWSCRVILFVLLAGYLPFKDSNLMQMCRKISKADFKCPKWFPPEVRRLLLRILDPNPNTRISMRKIMENPWFRKGLDSNGTLGRETARFDADFEPKKPDSAKVSSFNAFDIISLLSGFDLSGLFVKNEEKDEAKFMSMKPVSTIVSKMEEIGTRLKMELGVRKGGVLRFERAGEGRKGALSIDIELFEITSSFHLVEVKKSCGDALEYRKMLKEEIQPALEDVVWAWHWEHFPKLRKLQTWMAH